VVINAGFDKKDHNSIPRNGNQKGLKPLDAKADHQT
jgi:hypothetical protein